jgi:nucleoside-diphosphate-sugar epimerase
MKGSLITGAGGFIGAIVARLLLRRGAAGRLVLSDRAMHPRIESLLREDGVEFAPADLTDPEACLRLVTPDIDTIFHFAGLVSGGAERNFETGYAVNIHAVMHVLEAARQAGTCPKVVFTSTIASFGGSNLPDVVDDLTFQHPQSSYGVAKVVGEQLLNDYSRRGFVDGRGVRLAATVVRDDPHAGLSCCTSALVREPVAGNDYVCPLSPETRIPILSARRTAEMLLLLAGIEAEALGDYRTINGPSLAPSLREIADAVANCGAAGLGGIRFEPDPEADAIVASWPSRFRAARAAALGLQPDASIERIVADYLAEQAAAPTD